MQVTALHKDFDALQLQHGNRTLNSVYGAGCVKRPRVMFVFINPTARNISSDKNWRGLRAPWLGTKNAWKLFYALGMLPKHYFEMTQSLKPDEWSRTFAKEIYSSLARQKVFVTNLAKCT